MTPEEYDRIVAEALAKDPPMSPEERARSDRIDKQIEEMEAKGRRQATAEQVAIWQAWGRSELRRIARENGDAPE